MASRYQRGTKASVLLVAHARGPPLLGKQHRLTGARFSRRAGAAETARPVLPTSTRATPLAEGRRRSDNGRVKHAAALAARIDAVFAADRDGLLPDHRKDHPWLTGALGDPHADVWFLAESPSLTQMERVVRPTPESQWGVSRADRLFRRMLVDQGFKDAPADAVGGWHCYITMS
jgi:hypothetical protein